MFTVGGKNSRSATGDFENQRDRHPDIPVFQNFNLGYSEKPCKYTHMEKIAGKELK